MPKLPHNLIDLYCDGNQLILLPKIPLSLEYLSCSRNNIVYLDKLPHKSLEKVIWDYKKTITYKYIKKIIY